MKVAVAAAMTVCLLSCMTLPDQEVRRFSEVPEQKVVLVGKLALSPPLMPGEQVLRTGFGRRLQNAVLLYCSEQIRDFRTWRPDTYEGSFAVVPGKTFSISVNRAGTIYVSGAAFYSIYDPPYDIQLHTFPSLFKLELNADDRAVYIGTIHYTRDEQNRLTMVSIRDDYKAAQEEFRERFTNGSGLRKALLAPLTLVP